jgi:hypothetical protein
MYLILPAEQCSWCLLSLWQKWVQDDFCVGKARPEHNADNPTAICEPIFRFEIQIYFRLQMGFYPVTVSLQQCNTQIHKSHTLIAYTQIHISHKITPRKTNKTKKNSQLTKLHKHWRTYYSQWIQHRNRKKNKAIPDTGLGGLLSCETSRLSHCLDSRFIVGG